MGFKSPGGVSQSALDLVESGRGARTWATATAYPQFTILTDGTATYRVLIAAYTSGASISADVSAGKLALLPGASGGGSALLGAAKAVSLGIAAIAAPSTLAVAAVGSGGSFAAATYFWAITYLNASGETTVSNEVSVAIVANGSATLSWGALPSGVTGVKVYRSLISGGYGYPAALSLVATLGAVTGYTDTGSVGVVGAPPPTNATGFTTSGVPASVWTDGVALVAGDRVLLVGQSNAVQNGPWIVAAGAWARPSDFAAGLVAASMVIPVVSGTQFANTRWTLSTATTITVDTSAQTWVLAVRTSQKIARLPDDKGNVIAGNLAFPFPGALSIDNIALGERAMQFSSNGKHNVALGFQAMGTTEGDYNIMIGLSAGGGAEDINGSTPSNPGFKVPARQMRNVVLGYQALIYGTTCADNVAIGSNAASEMRSGRANTAVGERSMSHLESGENNVAIGAASLFTNIIGSSNVAVGASALSNALGSDNTSVGSGSTVNVSTGTLITALGNNAGRNFGSGSNNTALGAEAGNTDGTTATVGTIANVTLVGAFAQATVGNVVVLGRGTTGLRPSVCIGMPGTAANLGNGVGVLSMADVTTAPTADHPAGAFIYPVAGKWKVRHASVEVPSAAADLETTRVLVNALRREVLSMGLVKPFPQSLTGVQGDYDASVIAGQVDLDALATFPDVANARNLIQSTAANKPLYRTNQYGVLPAITFDGTNDLLDAATQPIALKPATVAMVLKVTDFTVQRILFGGSPGNGCLALYVTTTGALSFAKQNIVSIGVSGASALTAGASALVVVTYDASGNYVLRVNRASVASGTNDQTLSQANLRLGGDNTGAFPFLGSIARVVVLNQALTGTNLSYLEDGLRAQWGTP